MREIKFRGKRIDNGEWVYGCLYYFNYESNPKNPVRCFIAPVNQVAYVNGEVVEEWEVDSETVGQFTGQRDEEHDADIHEGDIIKIIDDCEEEHITIVEFREGAFVADVYDQDYDETALGWAICCWDNSSSDWEVIGNKWDNPELLEVEK